MATRLAVNKLGNLGIGAAQLTYFLGTKLLNLDRMAIVNAQRCQLNIITPTRTVISLPIFVFSCCFLRDDDARLRSGKGPKASAHSVS